MANKISKSTTTEPSIEVFNDVATGRERPGIISTTSIFREIAHGRRKCLIAVEMLLIYEQPYETVNGTTDVKLTPDDTKMDDGLRRGRYSRW
ncbi:hypothetical protein YC2023_017030 [Brassica napus]